MTNKKRTIQLALKVSLTVRKMRTSNWWYECFLLGPIFFHLYSVLTICLCIVPFFFDTVLEVGTTRRPDLTIFYMSRPQELS